MSNSRMLVVLPRGNSCYRLIQNPIDILIGDKTKYRTVEYDTGYIIHYLDDEILPENIVFKEMNMVGIAVVSVKDESYPKNDRFSLKKSVKPIKD